MGTYESKFKNKGKKNKWLLKEQKKGMNLKIRKELGVNLSNSFKDERKNGTTNSHRKLF